MRLSPYSSPYILSTSTSFSNLGMSYWSMCWECHLGLSTTLSFIPGTLTCGEAIFLSSPPTAVVSLRRHPVTIGIPFALFPFLRSVTENTSTLGSVHPASFADADKEPSIPISSHTAALLSLPVHLSPSVYCCCLHFLEKCFRLVAGCH